VNGVGPGSTDSPELPTIAEPFRDIEAVPAGSSTRERGIETVAAGGSARERDLEQGPEEAENEALLDTEEEVEENEALEEIDNVLWIKNKPITHQNRCLEALESWAAKDQLFTSRIDRKRKQSSDFQNEVYQLIGFDSVFQGVLLTAVSQSNLLHCNNTWTATLLSALASFVTITGVFLKLRAIRGLEHTIAGEESTRRALVSWQLDLKDKGQAFDFNSVTSKNRRNDKKKQQQDKRSARWLQGSFLAVVVTLILFSIAFVVSIRQILCNPGRNPYS
jgi:hypothetical protein